ncbi:mono/diheme cytochrome c family protein [Pseudomonas duriflava]|uniref:Mono/diheme cytochrome c family protein n=1 Tax=Pseudomonas duriflava TaxID=459528 RepID=A0A562QMU9_9PSED|nr:cytochrome c [Pseudomonas duriflava]TWI57386.1 mono/diheme cytochrome c family protein [Pseudomonas duriflava]
MKTILSALALSLLASSAFAQDAAPDQALIKQGEYLARAGDCVACHTAQGGKPFAGGLPMETPIGTIYSTNITPDKSTGIGNYSFEDFDKAVRHGIAKEGYTLYPAMPYPSYARVTKEDMKALYAYFMSGVDPVTKPNQDVDIPWPLSMRWPLAAWRMLFAPEVADFTPAPGQDPVIARGAYLVEGLGHCGACHTPRGFAMQEKALSDADGKDFLAGSAPLEGWIAKSLRNDHKDGIARWDEAQLVEFLKTGRSDDMAVFGGMTQVVEHSLQYLSDEDLTAIVRYLKTLSPVHPDAQPYQRNNAVSEALVKGDESPRGAAVYIDNCNACHRSDGLGYDRAFPALAGNPVVQTDDPTSLIHIVLEGGTLPGLKHAPSTIVMPPFGWRLDDQQVADVVTFIRTSWGNKGGPVDPKAVAALRNDKNRTTSGDDVGQTAYSNQPDQTPDLR